MIYFIKSEEYVKVGYSANVEKRFKQYITENPNPITLIAKFNGGFSIEKKIHKQLNKWKHRGEWFKLTDDCKIKIDQIVLENKFNGEPIFLKDKRGAKAYMILYDILKLYTSVLGSLDLTLEFKKDIAQEIGADLALVNKHINYLLKLKKLIKINNTYYLK